MSRWRRGIEKICDSQSYSFLVYCSSFIFGIFCFSWINVRGIWPIILYILILVVLFLMVFFWPQKNKRTFVIVGALFLLGCLRMVLSVPENNEKQISFFVGAKKDIVGHVVGYPIASQNSVKYYFQPEGLVGRILITTSLYPKYYYGDYLKISCVLNLPENGSDRFRYDKYLARYGATVLCYQPKIEQMVGSGGSWWQRQISSWRRYLQTQIERLWPAPESALMSGLLYGDSSALPDSVKDNFSSAGITHIVAVSGYNTSIIVVAVMAILIFVGVYRKQAFWMTNSQLVLFVIFTGASASVVRAAIMASAMLLAERIGRSGSTLNILALTAGVMVFANPYILVWDIGFQLSFLSTIGIVYLNPIVSPKLFFLPEWLGKILSPTLSAIMMTAPLTMYQFGRFSLVAPLANILVLWLVPILMFLGLLVLLINIISSIIASTLAWIAFLGLHYIIMIAKTLGGWSGASWQLMMPGWMMVGVYVFIIVYLCNNKYNSNINNSK